MIKRNGAEIMNARTKNVSVAKETLEVLKQKKYTSISGRVVDITGSLDAAIKGTKYYPADVEIAVPTGSKVAKFEVTNETTSQAAARLVASGKDVVALNFASARNQGGGFLSGAIAQEEDLCRASGLYACIKSKPLFYNANIMCDDTYYTNGIIYSPKVPFFRNEHGLFIDEPFLVSIVSAPAPNLRSMENVNEDLLIEKLLVRAIKILQAAAVNGHSNIILGAWGCGAFGNNPEMVANVFKVALEQVPSFENVYFAVYDTRTPPVLYETFRKVYE